ncbi:hypothetical protein SNE40_009693 [Patella caerulea]
MTVGQQEAELAVELLEPVSLGWALKTAAKRRPFSATIKTYLLEQFLIGLNTGRKEDPAAVSKRIKTRFLKPDWLTSRQVASYFSRLAALQKCGRLNMRSQQIKEVENDEQCEVVGIVMERYRLRRRVISDLDE